jgi:hypothetical protein
VFAVIGQSNQKLGVFLLAAMLSGGAAAQGMFKCKDAAGKITYAGKECHLLGLSDAGEVTGRAVVTPAVKLPPSSPATAAPVSAPPVDQGSAKAPEAPAESERRCFKTAKGMRCNDSPADTEPGTK